MLGAVTCHFNPFGYTRLRDNYFRFRDSLNYPITTVELAFDDDPFQIDDAIHVRGTRAKNYMWQKERLLNIAIESLPQEVDNVVWIDADLLFMNKDWAQDTEEQLEKFPVVQPFRSLLDLDAKGNHLLHGQGYAAAEAGSDDKIHVKRPGGAFAFRRSILPEGLYDRGILGSGDSIQLNAWIGDWNALHLKLMGPKFKKHWLQWAVPHYERVRGQVGFVEGLASHMYHGSRKDRQYGERTWWLVESDFEPMADIKIDENGLLAWATDKPLLHDRCRGYHESRREDD